MIHEAIPEFSGYYSFEDIRNRRAPSTGPSNLLAVSQPLPPAPCRPWQLFYFDGGAGVHELLLDRLRLVLINALFDGLRSGLHQVLRFLQAKAGNFTYHLDYIDLIGANSSQYDRKLGLFLDRSRCRFRASARRSRYRRS